MQLFYSPTISESEKSFVFDKEESKHIIKVLRKKESDILFVTNGLGFIFKTEITLPSDSKCTVSILSFEKQEPSKFHLHLAVAPTKMNERYEWFLEKATEIGINRVIPLLCRYSERKEIKNERLEKVMVSAMKQSLKAYLPQLDDLTKFKDLINQPFEGQKFIAHCEEQHRDLLKNLVVPNQNYLILIGPEGDFSTDEIEMALKAGFQPVSLGESRLRTETAGLVACHTFNLLNE